jgi:hypothetical protein
MRNERHGVLKWLPRLIFLLDFAQGSIGRPGATVRSLPLPSADTAPAPARVGTELSCFDAHQVPFPEKGTRVKTAWRPLRLSCSPLPLSTRHAISWGSCVLRKLKSQQGCTQAHCSWRCIWWASRYRHKADRLKARRAAARAAEALFDAVPFSEGSQGMSKRAWLCPYASSTRCPMGDTAG